LAGSVENSLFLRERLRQLKNRSMSALLLKTKTAPSYERTRFQRRKRFFMGKNRNGIFSTALACTCWPYSANAFTPNTSYSFLEAKPSEELGYFAC